MDATWHSGPRGSAMQAHAAPTRRIIISIIHIVHSLYKWVFSFPYIGKVFKPIKPTLLLNPIAFFNFSHMGLSPT